MKIEWRGGIGYGDFVTGLGYASNCTIKYNVDVDFIIHWDHNETYKPNPNDPETILERCQYVYELFCNKRMSLTQITNSKPNFRFINQFHEFDPVHGMYNLPLEHKNKKYIVMWTSLNNTVPVKKFKDPLSKNDWLMVKDIVKDFGYDVIDIDYRTPIADVIDLCQNSAGGIGYDGSIHQIFKLIQKPIILFCERTELNKLLLPWATQYKNFEKFFHQDSLFEESKNNLIIWQEKHKQWLEKKIDYKTEYLYNIPT